MKDFTGKLAIVTGGGSGIGRELVLQLAATGCRVAACDLNLENLEETRSLASGDALISLHRCDVGDESQVQGFASEVLEQHQTDHINLLFNNAGIGGGGSFILDERTEWDRTFNVCWQGVYYCARAFMPLLVASDEGHIVNISSVNGFWACMGPQYAHTAYSAAKFAVKGFTEALLVDARLNAPHVGVSLVMPGHIGTGIVVNSQAIQGMASPEELDDEEIARVRSRWGRIDAQAEALSDEDVKDLLARQGEMFRDTAPTSAAQAAGIILDGVRENRWRILVGGDAHILDERVRAAPEQAYEIDFFDRLTEAGVFADAAL
jgi:NAD(P)-dependent dehydrogenase (short-subunit alcohol dehydrogenase family)